MDRTTRRTARAMLVAFTLTGAGCAHSRPDGRLTIRGELVSGAECPMIVANDGRRYSVTGSLGPFKIGDRVCIRGEVAEMSICMAGESTVAIESIAPEHECP